MRFPRPFFTALAIWICSLLVLFVLVDYLIMPWVAGKFRATVEVPAVTGLEVEAAADTLNARGLSLAIDTAAGEYDMLVPRGRILSQIPEAGALVKEGRRVWVGRSLGREPFVVPGGDF